MVSIRITPDSHSIPEGSFSTIVDKNKTRKLGWRIQTKFQLGLHIKDLPLLLKIQHSLGGIGSIHSTPAENKVNYSIDSKQDLLQLIDHLDKYPLLTQKKADFLLFKEVVELIINKSHLTMEGLKQIINIKASMNLGLSDFLKSEFTDYTPVERPAINTEEIPDSNWVSGFVSGDGNFDVRIYERPTNPIGYRIQLRFRVTQHDRDRKLLECLSKYLGSGSVTQYSGKAAVVLTITKFSDITNIIIPFFDNNPLLGVKLLDYLDWCKIAKLMSEGSHSTSEGLNLIIKIKSGMNTGREL
ncbi:hypothetical protein FRC08_005123 [Ceratobasidium sp. 394]|nr:hypothetical protein FRC08_005123 [Ceratobasidium sp. 394]